MPMDILTLNCVPQADHMAGDALRHKIEAIERIISEDVGRRGIQRIAKKTSGNLLRAARSLAKHPSPHVAICTGFYIPQASAAETDGPVGAAQLAAGLAESGIPVRVITDHLCQATIAAALRAASPKVKQVEVYDPTNAVQWAECTFTHFISIERAGPSKSGRIFNMSGMDIMETTPPLHELFSAGEWEKIAIGDGGNEIGMGVIPSAMIEEDIQHGDKIACVIPCDYLIVAGVSNWGALGLLAALSLLRPDWNLKPFLDSELVKRILHSCVEEGDAVDGITLKHEPTVDGLPQDTYLSVSQRVLSICE